MTSCNLVRANIKPPKRSSTERPPSTTPGQATLACTTDASRGRPIERPDGVKFRLLLFSPNAFPSRWVLSLSLSLPLALSLRASLFVDASSRALPLPFSHVFATKPLAHSLTLHPPPLFALSLFLFVRRRWAPAFALGPTLLLLSGFISSRAPSVFSPLPCRRRRRLSPPPPPAAPDHTHIFSFFPSFFFFDSLPPVCIPPSCLCRPPVFPFAPSALPAFSPAPTHSVRRCRRRPFSLLLQASSFPLSRIQRRHRVRTRSRI